MNQKFGYKIWFLEHTFDNKNLSKITHSHNQKISELDNKIPLEIIFVI